MIVAAAALYGFSWAGTATGLRSNRAEAAVRRIEALEQEGRDSIASIRAIESQAAAALARLQAADQRVVQLEKIAEFLTKSTGSPTAASQGIYPTRVVVRWTRPQIFSGNSLSQDYRYAIYRRKAQDQGVGLEIAQVSAEQSVYIDETVEPGVLYQYRIYRYPSNPTGVAPEMRNHVWLLAGDDPWTDGWAGDRNAR